MQRRLPVRLLSCIACCCYLFITGCSTSKQLSKPTRMAAELDLQGHRGCRGLLPENSIPAMIRALDFPVTTLEMDVVISQDNQVVVSHDPFFSHEISTTPEGDSIAEAGEQQFNLYKLTYADIRKFDVGSKPHPRFPQQQKIKTYKPLLRELIDSVKASMMTRRRPFPYFNIETKTTAATDHRFHPEPETFVELLMQVIREKDISDQCIIQSFDIRTLQYLRQHYPSMATALLIEEGDERSIDTQLKTLGFTPSIYSPHYSLATPATIQTCHQRGMKIIPWTVNDLTTMQTLVANGVDGLISDYPNLYVDLKQ